MVDIAQLAVGDTIVVDGKDTVSYTHLDVYKRQLLRRRQAQTVPAKEHFSPPGRGRPLGTAFRADGRSDPAI